MPTLKRKLKQPEVWMAVLPADVLVDGIAEWDFVRRHVDGVKFWTQQIDQEAHEWPFQGEIEAPDALRKLVTMLVKNDISIIIEKGVWPPLHPEPSLELMGGKHGPMDETFSERAAENEIARMRKMEQLGAQVRFLDVDGPIRHLLQPIQDPSAGFKTIGRCVEVFLDYMDRVHDACPYVEFFALTNFPNWGYKDTPSLFGDIGWGDYFEVLTKLLPAAKQAGAPLRGITVDNPYDYTIGEAEAYRISGIENPKAIDWLGRILDVERYVRQHDLEFNLIFNSERAGEASAALFNQETLEFLDLYHQAGGSPDRYIVQSWYTHPMHHEVLPESDPNAFAGLVKEVIERVKLVND